MNAPDGEQVSFVGKVIVDGPVEEWLIKVRGLVNVRGIQTCVKNEVDVQGFSVAVFSQCC